MAKLAKKTTETTLVVNISTRSYVGDISFKCLQDGCKIALTPFINQIHSKTEMSYAII